MPTKYHTSRIPFWIGFLAWAFAIYMLLYNAGHISEWIAFSKPPARQLEGWLPIILLSLVGGGLLISRRFASLSLDDKGMCYKWLGSRRVEWKDVEKVIVGKQRQHLVMIAKDKRIETLWADFPNFTEICENVVKQAQMGNPGAVIDYRK